MKMGMVVEIKTRRIYTDLFPFSYPIKNLDITYIHFCFRSIWDSSLKCKWTITNLFGNEKGLAP